MASVRARPIPLHELPQLPASLSRLASQLRLLSSHLRRPGTATYGDAAIARGACLRTALHITALTIGGPRVVDIRTFPSSAALTLVP